MAHRYPVGGLLHALVKHGFLMTVPPSPLQIYIITDKGCMAVSAVCDT